MHARAVKHLRSQDPRLAEWIDRIGLIKLPARETREPFPALLEAIAHQQLAGAAAKAIWNRVLCLFPEGRPEPGHLVSLADEHLRGAGLSRSKAHSMKEIAARTLAGDVPDAKRIACMSEGEIIDQLTKIRGVGPWTVDMLLIFTLRRPDILPLNDYGVRKGFQVLYRKRKLPTPKQLLVSAECWRPYRTTAALYLWRIADAPKKTKARKARKTTS
ncbi:MAG: DNA-3-methyladenine glycosylase 2 family protein [Steroidobacteraceae bacterium]|jgi:3-methyladenine DNA glycosylase/8-oxoguanine DNA glycosylase